MDQVTDKRKPGRPRKTESRAERHVTEVEKTPEVAKPVRRRKKYADNYIGPLYIPNPPAGYVLRFVEDRSENGASITKRLANDWEFVTTEDDIQISEGYVFTHGQFGGCYRIPAGKNSLNWLYLMKIREEWYEEDQAAKQARIDKSEKGLFKVDKTDGEYGAGD